MDLADTNPNLINDTRGLYEVLTVVQPYSFSNNTTDSLAAYDYAVTSIWPVLVNIYYKDDSSNMSFSDFRCLRAQNISEGSRKPETLGVREQDASENWGCHIALPMLWHMISTAAVLAVLFVI